MSNFMRSNIVIVLIFAMIAAMMFLSGCTETQKQPPQYGQGDPPDAYQEYFGNDNGARLDFMQNKAIGELSARIGRLENPVIPDSSYTVPNGVEVVE